MLIVFEGIDGSGKSTALEICKDLLKDKNPYVTRSLGGAKGSMAEKIREVLFEQGKERPSEINAALILANMLLVNREIRKHPLVLLDRYCFSTLAYQFYAENKAVPMDFWDNILDLPVPQLIVQTDCPTVLAKRRISQRSQEANFYDLKPDSYFNAVREGFRMQSKQYRDKWIIIDTELNGLDDVRDILAQKLHGLGLL